MKVASTVSVKSKEQMREWLRSLGTNLTPKRLEVVLEMCMRHKKILWLKYPGQDMEAGFHYEK